MVSGSYGEAAADAILGDVAEVQVVEGKGGARLGAIAMGEVMGNMA